MNLPPPFLPLLRQGLCPGLCLGLLLLAAPSAVALECDGVDELGSCLDDHTLVWCDEGVLVEAICPAEEICKADHPSYDGANCIRLDQTECAEVTGYDGTGNEIAVSEYGACTSAAEVVSCVRGQVELKHCDAGTVCGCPGQALDSAGELVFDDEGNPVLECDCVAESGESPGVADSGAADAQTLGPEPEEEPEAGGPEAESEIDGEPAGSGEGAGTGDDEA